MQGSSLWPLFNFVAKSSKLNFRFEKKVSKWDFSEEIIVAILWRNLEFNKKKSENIIAWFSHVTKKNSLTDFT